jgi:hypothetical protein
MLKTLAMALAMAAALASAMAVAMAVAPTYAPFRVRCWPGQTRLVFWFGLLEEAMDPIQKLGTAQVVANSAAENEKEKTDHFCLHP